MDDATLPVMPTESVARIELDVPAGPADLMRRLQFRSLTLGRRELPATNLENFPT
jgi:hypothetical protein